MQSNSVKFIATSTTFLNRLQKVEWKGRHELSIEVRNKEVIFIDTDITLYANAITGEGVFTFDIKTIHRLINCLKVLSEQPLTFNFQDHTILTIEQIMF